MKKEASVAEIDIDKMYGLSSYEKNDFTQLMMKEFRKYGKKLEKIQKYETMLKDGQTLSHEMRELIEKKDQFIKHLDSLKLALDYYAKASSTRSVPQEVAPVQPKAKEVVVVIDNTELLKETAKTLGYFFAVASSIQHKEELLPNPFLSSSIPTAEQQSGIQKAYKLIANIREEQETTLGEEAKKAETAIYKLLTKSKEPIRTEEKEGDSVSYSEVSSVINQISNTSLVSNTKYRTYKKGDTQILQYPNKELYMSQYFQEAVASPAKKEKEVGPELLPVVQEAQEREASISKKSSWIEAGEADVGSTVKKGVLDQTPQLEENEEDEFTVVTDKQEERKKKVEERGRFKKGRGAYRGQGENISRSGESRGRGRASVRRSQYN